MTGIGFCLVSRVREWNHNYDGAAVIYSASADNKDGAYPVLFTAFCGMKIGSINVTALNRQKHDKTPLRLGGLHLTEERPNRLVRTPQREDVPLSDNPHLLPSWQMR